jgi:hypothetical protein
MNDHGSFFCERVENKMRENVQEGNEKKGRKRERENFREDLSMNDTTKRVDESSKISNPFLSSSHLHEEEAIALCHTNLNPFGTSLSPVFALQERLLFSPLFP